MSTTVTNSVVNMGGMKGRSQIIRDARKALKLTQQELADELGISRVAVTKWEGEAGDLITIEADNRDGLERVLGIRLSSSSRALEHKLQRTGSHSIPRLDVRASMGNGIALRDVVEVIEMVDLNVDELCRARGVSISSPKNLRIVTGYGPSMLPTFDHLDQLLVDTGVTDLKVEDVYCMENAEELYIKRIQRVPGKKDTYMMISDNKAFRDFEIEDPLRTGFTVHGRVVIALNIKKIT